MTNAVEIRNLTISFEDKKIIDNLTYSFPSNKTTIIAGASGVGKTSLINAIMNLIPYEGTIEYAPGTRFSAVFQENRLVDGISAYRNLKIAAPALTDSEIKDGFVSVGLENDMHTPVSRLSGGMKRRVALLRALLTPYDILIMDEPFKGLDETTAATVKAYVRKKTSEKTVLLITHDSSEVNSYSNILFLES